MIITVYKIRDTATGKFSSGGCSPRWTNYGKSWNTIGQLKTSLRQHCDVIRPGWTEFKNNIPETWEIITLSNTEIQPFPARSLYPEKFLR